MDGGDQEDQAGVLPTFTCTVLYVYIVLCRVLYEVISVMTVAQKTHVPLLHTMLCSSMGISATWLAPHVSGTTPCTYSTNSTLLLCSTPARLIIRYQARVLSAARHRYPTRLKIGNKIPLLLPKKSSHSHRRTATANLEEEICRRHKRKGQGQVPAEETQEHFRVLIPFVSSKSLFRVVEEVL